MRVKRAGDTVRPLRAAHRRGRWRGLLMPAWRLPGWLDSCPSANDWDQANIAEEYREDIGPFTRSMSQRIRQSLACLSLDKLPLPMPFGIALGPVFRRSAPCSGGEAMMKIKTPPESLSSGGVSFIYAARPSSIFASSHSLTSLARQAVTPPLSLTGFGKRPLRDQRQIVVQWTPSSDANWRTRKCCCN